MLAYFGSHHAGRNSAWREGHLRSTKSRRKTLLEVERCSFVVTSADSLGYRTSTVYREFQKLKIPLMGICIGSRCWYRTKAREAMKPGHRRRTKLRVRIGTFFYDAFKSSCKEISPKKSARCRILRHNIDLAFPGDMYKIMVKIIQLITVQRRLNLFTCRMESQFCAERRRRKQRRSSR